MCSSYRTTDLSRLGERFDVVYDTAATMPTSVGLALLREKGVLLDLDPTPAKFLRVFCADRIRHADFLDEHYPGNRRRLAKEWRSDYCRRGAVDRAAE